MKGASRSVFRMMTTTTMQTIERTIMKGASHETYFCSGGKSICFSISPPL
jgi:hypothetical protein